MVLSPNQIESEKYFHEGPCSRTHGPRGGTFVSIKTWRRNGATKYWKREPKRFSIPVEYGLHGHGIITNNNAYLFHAEEDCPLRNS